MRTKALVLAAAVGALGVASSMAVNSVNVVGYINKTCNSGFTLVANQLKVGGNTLGEVIPGGINGLQLFVWDTVGQTYASATYYTVAAAGVPADGWYDDGTGESASAWSFAPGAAGFILNDPTQTGQASVTLTFVGDVPQTPDALGATLTPAYKLLGSPVPVSKALDDNATFGFPAPPEGSQYFKWKVLDQGYDSFTYYTVAGSGVPADGWYSDGTGEPGLPVLDVGEGFFILNIGASFNWSFTFNVN